MTSARSQIRSAPTAAPGAADHSQTCPCNRCCRERALEALIQEEYLLGNPIPEARRNRGCAGSSHKWAGGHFEHRLLPEFEAILADVPRAPYSVSAAGDGLEMEAPTVTGETCIKSFAVGGFPFAVNTLNNAQKRLIARIAQDIVSGGGGAPPLTRAHKVRIIGFASGTRNLARHANNRAVSVFEELTKQLRARGATATEIAKVEFGDPVTTLVTGQSASDPKQRKVVVCIVKQAPPPVKPNDKSACTDRQIARFLLDMDLPKAMRAHADPIYKAQIHRTAVVCIRRMLTSKLVDGDPIDDDIVVGWKGLRSSTTPQPIIRNLTKEMQAICARTGRVTARDFLGLYVRIVRPIMNDIVPELMKVLMDLTTHPFGGPRLREVKARIPECRAVKPLYERTGRRNSIYWCMRHYIRSAVGKCFT